MSGHCEVCGEEKGTCGCVGSKKQNFIEVNLAIGERELRGVTTDFGRDWNRAEWEKQFERLKAKLMDQAFDGVS